MSGLARLCRLYGSLKIQGETWVWDYVTEKAVRETEMPIGSERRAASERKRWTDLRDTPAPPETEGGDNA